MMHFIHAVFKSGIMIYDTYRKHTVPIFRNRGLKSQFYLCLYEFREVEDSLGSFFQGATSLYYYVG